MSHVTTVELPAGQAAVVSCSDAARRSNLESLRRTIIQAKAKEPKELDRPLNLKHGWLLPYLLNADEHLWGRWHHWFEIATARKVIGSIPKIEWQSNQAGFKMLDRSLSCITKYGDWRGWNSWVAFDYFMDWLLFGFGHPGQRELPSERNEYQGASDRLYQVFNLETLLAFPHDYLGDILAENHHDRHLGFYPTPMSLCELMTQMTVAGEDARTKSVCDPCVGTGRMLLTASNHSYRLYGQDINPTVIKATLVNGYLYAPWLVRPSPFLDAPLCDPAQSQTVSDAITQQARQTDTEHDPDQQWQFEPIKKRRRMKEPVESGCLLNL